MPDLITRSVLIDRADQDKRLIHGRAVPYNDPITLWPGLREQFAPGSVTVDDQTPKLFWQHETAIGVITNIEDRDDGAYITARISQTPQGDEALTLVRDGVLDRLSVGFLPRTTTRDEDEEGTLTLTRTKVLLREVSIVNFPAYPEAKITSTRHHHQEDHTMEPDTTATAVEALAAETRASLDEMNRQIASLAATSRVHVTAEHDSRSAGQVLRDITAGDQATIDRVNAYQARDYSGVDPSQIPDDLPAGIVNLVKIVNDASTTAALFGERGLPPTGMNVDFLRLKSVNAKYDNQAKAGDDLTGPTKVEFETTAEPIEVAGGWSELDIPRIQRMPVNVTDTMLQAMAIAAGKHLAAKFAAKLNALYTSISASRKLVVADWTDWKLWAPAIRRAGTAFRRAGAPVTGLLLDGASFDALAATANSNGEPMLLAQGTAVNQSGVLSLTNGDGSLLTMPVHVFDDAAGDFACFYNADAIRTYKDPVVQLQSEKIINLTKQFSIYQLSAVCDEVPGLLLPVTKA